MQGINRAYIYHATETDYTTPEYLEDLKTSLEKAIVGWNLTCDIDNNKLIVTQGDIKIFEFYIYNQISGLIHIDFYFDNNTQSCTLETGFYIHEIIYSTRFIAFQMRYKEGIDNNTTPIFITKSSNNNIVSIFPASTGSLGTSVNKKSLNTAFYDEHSVGRTCAVISKNSASCPKSSVANTNNEYSNTIYNGIVTYPLVTNHISNDQKLTMIPLVVNSTNEIEYASYSYYIVTNSFSLQSSINAIMKIGNDYYFTNGIVAIKLT